MVDLGLDFNGCNATDKQVLLRYWFLDWVLFLPGPTRKFTISSNCASFKREIWVLSALGSLVCLTDFDVVDLALHQPTSLNRRVQWPKSVGDDAKFPRSRKPFSRAPAFLRSVESSLKLGEG